MDPVIKLHPKQPIPKRKEVWVHMVFLKASVKFLPTPSCTLLTQNKLIPICASWSFLPCKICFQPCWKGSSTAQWRAEKSKSGLGHPQLPLPKVTCMSQLLPLSVPQLPHAQGVTLCWKGMWLSQCCLTPGNQLHTKEQKDKSLFRGTGTCSQVLRAVVPLTELG